MARVIDLEERKNRSHEAATTKNISLGPIVSRNDSDYVFIFSKKIDKFLDQCAPGFLVFAAVYFIAHLFWYIVR